MRVPTVTAGGLGSCPPPTESGGRSLRPGHGLDAVVVRGVRVVLVGDARRADELPVVGYLPEQLAQEGGQGGARRVRVQPARNSQPVAARPLLPVPVVEHRNVVRVIQWG